jgi:hypothetical protein
MGRLDTLEAIQNAESFWGLDSSDCHGSGHRKSFSSPPPSRDNRPEEVKHGCYLEYGTENGKPFVRYVSYNQGVEIGRGEGQSLRPGSNRRPQHYECCALSTELRRHI